MTIRNHKFSFSAFNADDIERVEQAQAKLQQASVQEAQRVQQEQCSYAERIRGQCRLIMAFLDEVLGEGAAQLLGLTGSNLADCRDVVEEIKAAIAAEKREITPALAVPVSKTAQPPVAFPPAEAPKSEPSTAALVKQLLADPEAQLLIAQIAKRTAGLTNG